MADSAVLWSSLPADILSIISKNLNSDVDIIRIRSVCSGWRSSVRRRYRPSPYPLEVAALSDDSEQTSGVDGHYFLTLSTLYRISPPEIGPYAGDPSDGWLLRVYEVDPNMYSLMSPLIPVQTRYHLDLIPKRLSLLDCRISEICKCYTLSSFGLSPEAEWLLMSIIKKVIVLWHYGVDCEFAVLILIEQGYFCYWKFGDKGWTPIAHISNKRCDIDDVVLCDGKCYAISRQGVLVYIDSEFNLTVASLPPLPVDSDDYYFNLVEYKSDLYVVAKFCKGNVNIEVNDDGDGRDDECTHEIPLELKIFKKGDDNWEYITCLGDRMFLFCDDLSLGLSAKDFKCCKDNCVFLSPEHLLPYGSGDERAMSGVSDLVKFRTSVMKNTQVDDLRHQKGFLASAKVYYA